MNKIWMGTNWKMTKTLNEGLSYCDELIDLIKDLDERIELFIIPSYTSLWPIKAHIRNSRIHLGAQNMHWEERGAFTGEISPLMLNEIGVKIVELGHSERRQYYNENDEEINKKVHSAIKFGMTPLICIGENINQKNQSISIETISSQLKVSLRGLTQQQAAEVLIAYEPVWAIGEGGIPAEPDYVGVIHSNIREILFTMFGESGKGVPILYGGSVNENNYLKYLELKDVNGLFIGRAAWNIRSFRNILFNIHL